MTTRHRLIADAQVGLRESGLSQAHAPLEFIGAAAEFAIDPEEINLAHRSTSRTDDYPTSDEPSGIWFAPAFVVTVGGVPINAFAQTTIVDDSAGWKVVDTLTISQSGPGKLSGKGLTPVSGQAGTYRLSGSASQVTAELQALVFTSNSSTKVTPASTSFTLSDTNSAGAAAMSATVVVTQSPDTLSSLPLGGTYNQIAAGDHAILVVAGDGNDRVVLGNGNDTVQLAGAYDTVTAGGGNDIVTEYANPAQGDANPCHDVVRLGNGNDNVALSGYRDTIAAGNGSDWIVDTGYEVSISAGSGQDTIVVGGTGNRVTLNGSRATVTGGQGSDSIAVIGGADTLTVAGPGDHVTITGRSTVSIFDLGQSLEIDVGSSTQHDVITANADNTGLVDLLHGAGGYSSVAKVMQGLHADGHGNTVLSLGSTGSIEFYGLAPSQLHASNFKIG